MSNPWFRMYAEFATDAKVQMLSEAMQRRLVMILCLRCSNALVTLHDDEIAFQLRISETELAETKSGFVSKGFIDSAWNVLNWDKRQFVSDSSTARVAKHRALQKEKQEQECNVTQTKSNVVDTDTDTDTEQIQKREEKKKATGVATPDGVSDSLWQDFKKLRAAKKSPITQTAIAGISREAAKAGLSLTTVLEMCCERGWVGFKAEWTQEKRTAFLPPQPNETVPSKTGIDPTLAKLNAEKAFVKPPSAEMRAKLAALKEGRMQ
jgi:hypothetical protein